MLASGAPAATTVVGYAREAAAQAGDLRRRWREDLGPVTKAAAAALVGRYIANHAFPTRPETAAARGREGFVGVAAADGRLLATPRLERLVAAVR